VCCKRWTDQACGDILDNQRTIPGKILQWLSDLSAKLYLGITFKALRDVDLLFIGAPTQGGRPTQPVQDFLKKIPESDIKNINIATFDTRISAKWVGIFGYAAGRIAKALKKKGAALVSDPAPFFVLGKEGPLKDGELERAAAWAREVISGLK